VQRHDSMFWDTTAGPISSSSNNSRPLWLEAPASDIGAEWRGAASSTIASRTTTSVLELGCGSTCISTLGSGAVVVTCSTTGSVVVASTVAASTATASRITCPSACGPVKNKLATYGCNDYSTQQVLTTAGYIPSTKVASSSLGSVTASSCGDSVGSCASVEQSHRRQTH
jgi:hypothetical protein